MAPSSTTVEPTVSLDDRAAAWATALSVVLAVDSVRSAVTVRLVLPATCLALTLTEPALPAEAEAPPWSFRHICWSGFGVGVPFSTTVSGRVQQEKRSALAATAVAPPGAAMAPAAAAAAIATEMSRRVSTGLPRSVDQQLGRTLPIFVRFVRISPDSYPIEPLNSSRRPR